MARRVGEPSVSSDQAPRAQGSGTESAPAGRRIGPARRRAALVAAGLAVPLGLAIALLADEAGFPGTAVGTAAALAALAAAAALAWLSAERALARREAEAATAAGELARWRQSLDVASIGLARVDDDGTRVAATAAFPEAALPARVGRLADDGRRLLTEEAGRRLLVQDHDLPGGGFVREIRDVTEERREADEALRRADARRQAAEALLSATDAQIRGTLCDLERRVSLLALAQREPDGRAQLDGIRDAVAHIADTLAETAGGLARDTRRDRFCPRRVVEELVSDRAAAGFAKGLEITVRVAPAVPAEVSGDAALFRSVVDRLLDRAVCATATGGVDVDLDVEGTDAEGAVRLRLTVEDTGEATDTAGPRCAGIERLRRLVAGAGGTLEVLHERRVGTRAVADMPLRVEEPARPVDRPRRTVVVAAASGIVRSHLFRLLDDLGQHAVDAESGAADGAVDAILADDAGMAALSIRPGWSSRLRKPQIPVGRLARPGDAEPVRPPFTCSLARPLSGDALGAFLDGLGRSASSSSGGRVLVVDDNPMNQQVLSAMLEHRGFSVDCADDGREAVTAVCRAAYDIVLMDISMPVMDGYTATRTIRALDGPASRVPIVAVTALSQDEDRRRAAESGMDGFVTKPVRIAALVAAVDAARRVRAAAEPLAAVLDESRLRRLADDVGAEVARDLLRIFVEDARARCDRLAGAGAAADMEALRKDAHALHGSAATVGAVRLGVLIERLGEACRARRPEEASDLLRDLPSVWRDTERALARADSLVGGT